MYILNQNQKNTITGYRVKKILDALNISVEELSIAAKLKAEKINAFLEGNEHLSAVAVSNIMQTLTDQIKAIFCFADEPQIHRDIDGYETED